MQYRELGNSGINASIIGVGTWVTGGGTTWGAAVDDGESVRAIHAALDAGVNLLDTAPCYGWGRSEEVVGKALQGRRSQVVLATKCGLVWGERGADHYFLDGKMLKRCLEPDSIRREIEDSLRRLQTDYIDLYQIHFPAMAPLKTPIAETLGCLLELKAAGKIRAIGVGNVSLDELQEYCGGGAIASNQFRYSMLWRQAETASLPACQAQHLSTLTYMSLEQGLLTGKIGLDRVFTTDEFRSNEDWNPWFKLENRPRVLALLEGWRGYLEKYRCSLAQLVLAWTAAQAGVTHVLCGVRKITQAQDNAAAGALVLEAADIANIRAQALALGDPK